MLPRSDDYTNDDPKQIHNTKTASPRLHNTPPSNKTRKCKKNVQHMSKCWTDVEMERMVAPPLPQTMAMSSEQVKSAGQENPFANRRNNKHLFHVLFASPVAAFIPSRGTW